MATNSYLREKLFEARHVLACHPGAIKERLKRAFLRFAPIVIEDVDEAYRCAYAKIVSTLLAKGSIEETMEAMDVSDAIEVAGSILDLLDKLELDQSQA